jgi:hypothetical protein
MAQAGRELVPYRAPPAPAPAGPVDGPVRPQATAPPQGGHDRRRRARLPDRALLGLLVDLRL